MYSQSATGLLLALFMWGHMFFVSSILLGKDAMWTVTRFFEGYFFFGASHPVDRVVVVAVVAALVVTHAVLAVRKFPINYRQHRDLPRAHADACATRTRRCGTGRWSPASRCSSSPRRTCTSC